MRVPAPHFLLTAEGSRANRSGTIGAWRFVLQKENGRRTLEVADAEPSVDGQRLELLAVVRGLEALPQPSRVTLLTRSDYVKRGFTYGLEEWRSNAWRWERHGEMVPIKNGDLWRRIDHALKYHSVVCRIIRHDEAHQDVAVNDSWDLPATGFEPTVEMMARPKKRWHGWHHAILVIRRRIRTTAERIRLKIRQCGTGLFPTAWLD